MVRRAHGRAYATVAIATGALVMTLVVATVETGSVFGGPRRVPDSAPSRQHATTVIHRSSPPTPVLPQWLGTVLILMLALSIITLIVLARGRRRAIAQRLMVEDEETEGVGDWEARMSVELGEAAAEQLAALMRGAARNAIVACWMRLQTATERAGLPAEPWETSREFTVRALRRLSLDDAAISTLSGLYREARFSDHEMAEPQRTEALTALEVLAGQLGSRSAVSRAERPTLDRVSL